MGTLFHVNLNILTDMANIVAKFLKFAKLLITGKCVKFEKPKTPFPDWIIVCTILCHFLANKEPKAIFIQKSGYFFSTLDLRTIACFFI